MNKFANKAGAQVVVDFTKSNIVNDHVFGKVSCVVDFQAIEICNVPGLVYVNFVPKGKRKMVSIAVHQDSLIEA